MQRVHVALDIETTGLDAATQRIIEVAAVKFHGDSVTDTFYSLVNPERPLPPFIRRLTGIAQAEVDAAPSFAAIAGDLARFIGSHPLVGHNLDFDIGFLSSHGLVLPGARHDTLALAAVLLPGLPSYALGSVAAALAVPPSTAHRALADATTAMHVWLRLQALTATLPPPLRHELATLAARGQDALAAFVHDLAAVPEAVVAVAPPSRAAPPQPRRHIAPPAVWSAAAVADAFAPGGALERTWAGFEHRPQQAQMAVQVARAIDREEHLLIEAGTGVGKSAAYLLPCLLFALAQEPPQGRVVLSTNTINLQEQLQNKDIPGVIAALTAMLGPSAEALVATTLKGRSNYLCRRRWEAFKARPSLSADEMQMALKLAVWLATTTTGDRAELNINDAKAALWQQLCSERDACLGNRCPHNLADACFLQRARRAAEAADLVIVNHSLLLADAATGGGIVPGYRYLVIDEAHHLEAEATAQFGFQLGQRQLLDLLERLPSWESRRLGRRLDSASRRDADARTRDGPDQAAFRAVAAAAATARQRATRFFGLLGDVAATRAGADEMERRLRLDASWRGQPAWQELELSWENLDVALAELDRSLGRLLARLEADADAGEVAVEIAVLQRSLAAWRTHLATAIVSPDDGFVYWVTIPTQGGAATISGAPIDVADLLQASVFTEKRAVVLTGATLTTAGSFDYAKARLGLTYARDVALDSPFDYAASTLVYIPTDLPEPTHPHYAERFAATLIELARASGGRALVLFTSNASLRAIAAAVTDPLETSGIAVLAQGIDGSAARVVDRFRDSPAAVLLGTASLWEGIDVVGEALSVVVIARLPFSVPTDPVFAARSEACANPFADYALPQAVLRFKQGFGRLIRSHTDRGVFAVFDRRIVSRRYGQAFLDSLPRCTVERGPAKDLPARAAAWLKPQQ